MGVGISMQGTNDPTLGDTINYMDDSEANPYEVYVTECNKKAQIKPTMTTLDSYTFKPFVGPFVEFVELWRKVHDPTFTRVPNEPTIYPLY